LVKIGLAIAPEEASPSAFVVFRDRLEVSIEKAAKLGYDGIELALLGADEIDSTRIRAALDRYGLELPVISTGRVFADAKVWFTHPDESVRRSAVERVKGLIPVASSFGAKVNVGRVRGHILDDEPKEQAEARFLACMGECADYAADHSVEMLLEPVNRYEINYLNSVPDVLEALDKLGRPNVKVMPDVFHMNIEDASITGSFLRAGNAVGYVHFADSNRRAPGQGHLDFSAIVRTLDQIGYDWYVTAEILPYPDPDRAAAAAIRTLRGLFPRSAQ
jgi:sugar phosphate isomerase/epimerase